MGDRAKIIKLWDVASAKEIASLKGHGDAVWALAFSPDGTILASGSGEFLQKRPGEVKLWDVATRKERASLRGHTLGVFSVAFSPDGQMLASGSGQLFGAGEFKLWN